MLVLNLRSVFGYWTKVPEASKNVLQVSLHSLLKAFPCNLFTVRLVVFLIREAEAEVISNMSILNKSTKNP